MKRLAFTVLLAACASEPGTDFPVQPNPGEGPTTDTDTGSGASMLRGRVCVVDDFFSSSRSATNAGGLTVSLGGSTTTTNDNGTFALDAPFGTGLSFLVSGPGIVPTSQALTATARIPVMTQVTYDAMLAANGITTTAGTGSVFATLVRGGMPVEGIGATSTPSPAFGPFYDGTQPPAWALNATGARGVVWFPGLAAGPVDLSFAGLTGGEATVGGVQVINGGVTMVEGVLP